MDGRVGSSEASSGARRRSSLLACALCVLTSACASLPALPSRPAEAARGRPPGLAHDPVPGGLLRPGDEVIIERGLAEERSQLRGRIDARGALHVGSERDVVVSGLSLKSAEERVTEVLRADDQFAHVTLLLASPATRRVTALGAVARQGTIEATPAMRVADLIAAAGGLLFLAQPDGRPPVEVADLDRAVLVREGTALPIDLRQALQAEPGHNVFVHPGDLLYVPFATENTVAVLGQVGTPRLLAHHAGMRLTEALAAAGGVTPDGAKGDIRVVRGPPHAPLVYRANLSAIADGEQHDSLLVSGDVVFVEDSFFEDLGEVFALAAPIAALGLLVAGFYVIATE